MEFQNNVMTPRGVITLKRNLHAKQADPNNKFENRQVPPDEFAADLGELVPHMAPTWQDRSGGRHLS